MISHSETDPWLPSSGHGRSASANEAEWRLKWPRGGGRHEWPTSSCVGGVPREFEINDDVRFPIDEI